MAASCGPREPPSHLSLPRPPEPPSLPLFRFAAVSWCGWGWCLWRKLAALPWASEWAAGTALGAIGACLLTPSRRCSSGATCVRLPIRPEVHHVNYGQRLRSLPDLTSLFGNLRYAELRREVWKDYYAVASVVCQSKATGMPSHNWRTLHRSDHAAIDASSRSLASEKIRAPCSISKTERTQLNR